MHVFKEACKGQHPYSGQVKCILRLMLHLKYSSQCQTPARCTHIPVIGGFPQEDEQITPIPIVGDTCPQQGTIYILVKKFSIGLKLYFGWPAGEPEPVQENSNRTLYCFECLHTQSRE